MNEIVDYYELLGVSRSAGSEEIIRAFKLQMHTSHPDRPGGSEEIARMLIQAREVLRDPAKRQAYDSLLRRTEARRTRGRPRRPRGRRRATSRGTAEEAARKAAEREAARKAAQHEAARRARRRHQGANLWDIVGAALIGGAVVLGVAAVAEACMSDD